MMVDSDLAVELAPLDYAEIASRNSLVGILFIVLFLICIFIIRIKLILMFEKCFYGSMESRLEIICHACLQGLLISQSLLVRLKTYLTKLVSYQIMLPTLHVLWLAEFLKMCAPIDHPFYKAVFNTQIFINFVEYRSFSYSMDTTLAFFDECTEKVIKSILLPEVMLILSHFSCVKTLKQHLSSHWQNAISMCGGWFRRPS